MSDNPLQPLSTWPNQQNITDTTGALSFPWGIWFTQLYNFVRNGAVTVCTQDTVMQATGTYIANGSARINLKLPQSFTVGSEIKIIGQGFGGWKITQNDGQIIHSTSSTTPGDGGSISSAAQYDNIVLQGMVTDLELTAISRNGALVIV